MRGMVAFEEARETLLQACVPLGAETVGLRDALGRTLAEDIIAESDLVPYARAAMDGYAVRAGDTDAASTARPVRLPVTGKVLARKGEATLGPGAALAITTGAPLPHEADAVIPFELVERQGDGILVSAPVGEGSSVFPPAEDICAGEVLARRGDVLRPATLALLAFAGHARIRVHRRPRVAVICTGDELVDVAATPGHGQIRNSNAVTLTALARECGALARYSGTARDTRAALGRLLRSARRDADLLVTTGGASKGERDFVKSVLAGLGARFAFREVAMRPGKPFGFAVWDTVPVCVLPGNPAAAFVCFQEFVQPAVLRLGGRVSTELPKLRAVLRGCLKSRADRRYFVLARLSLAPSGFEVVPLANQCSALVRNAAEANALILLPAGAANFAAGDPVEVQVVDWSGVVGVGQSLGASREAAAHR